MGKKTKVGKGRLDKFYHLAKEQGFRSRAAFKLVQLNRKYDFLSRASVCIDLCAAPGGWCQVAAKYMPVAALIVGVDLVPIPPIRGVITLQEDITTAKCRQELRRALKDQPADIVLNDGAPNVGGTWAKDAYSQSELTLHAARLACDFLRPGGTFVTKVFRSQDYNSLLWAFQQVFKKVEATKPQASRTTSAEIFVVCQGFLAPKQIDPKLFDPKFVFEQIAPQASSESLLNKLGHRNRSGYDDDARGLLFRASSVGDFVRSADPIKVLVECNKLDFDAQKDTLFANHPLTDTSVRTMLNDLKLLSKHDFRRLLRWRSRMRELAKLHRREQRERDGAESDDESGSGSDAGEEGDEADSKPQTFEEALADAVLRKSQKDRQQLRRERKLMSKQQQRVALKMNLASDLLQDQESHLFSLGAMRTEKDVAAVKAADHDVDVYVDSSASEVEGSDSDSDASDADDAKARYARKLEASLDAMYEAYSERKRQTRRRQRERIKEAGLDGIVAFSDSDDDTPRATPSVNPLLQSDETEKQTKAARNALQWFSQDVFDHVDDADDDKVIREMADSYRRKRSAETGAKPAASSSALGKRSASAAVPDDETDDEAAADADAADDDDDHDDVGVDGDDLGAADDDDDDAAAIGSASDDDSDLSDVDERDRRARTLAMGQAMLDRQKRSDMIDDAFNRYSFNDGDALPQWFKDDQAKHMHRHIDVEREDLKRYRDRLMPLDARPIKKVLEAKARKQKRAALRLERVKSQANKIVESSELSEGAKARAVERLYRKNAKKPTKVQFVVQRKAGGTAPIKREKGARIKLVDPRMKSASVDSARVAVRARARIALTARSRRAEELRAKRRKMHDSKRRR